MSSATVGASFSAMGASASTVSAVKAVYTGAVIGAVISAGVSMISGDDDIMGAAMKGALIGGVTSGISSSSGSGQEVSATGEAGMPQTEAVNLETGQTPVVSSQTPAAQTASPQNVQNVEDQGLFARGTNWIEKNPKTAEILSQTVGGAVKAIADKKKAEQEREFLRRMQQERINAGKVRNRDVTTGSVLPSISEFAERPKFVQKPEWRLDDAGLFPKQ